MLTYHLNIKYVRIALASLLGQGGYRRVVKTYRIMRAVPENMATYPEVLVIILNWNGLEDTIECLESLKG